MYNSARMQFLHFYVHLCKPYCICTKNYFILNKYTILSKNSFIKHTNIAYNHTYDVHIHIYPKIIIIIV